jgi:hypothetical protein
VREPRVAADERRHELDAKFEAARLVTYIGATWLPGPPAWAAPIPLSSEERIALRTLELLRGRGVI